MVLSLVWLIGEAVDAIPDDMTRKGIRITSEIDAKDRGTLEAQLDQLQIWDALNDVLKWSRLYGGAVGFIMIEGQAPMAPLRLETIGEGKFMILPLDRWMINPVLTRRIKEMGPNLGKPELYDVVTTAAGIPAAYSPQSPDSLRWGDAAIPAEDDRERMGNVGCRAYLGSAHCVRQRHCRCGAVGLQSASADLQSGKTP